jgi:ribosomal-protein-alanine N-acetyltransferase
MFDFTVFPTLQTERLILREMALTDAADALVFWGDPEVQKYNAEPIKTVAEATASIQLVHEWYRTKQEIIWGITRRGEDRVLGSCSLFQWNRHHRRAEIGYDLAHAEWGIGREAVGAVLRFGFDVLQLHRFDAYTIIDNHPSVRMLQKLGFQLEGIRREYSWEDDGAYHGSAVFGLLRHEYPSVSSS